jgi:DNA replicative helicase MCM subunit Mcm2 (Cdc46/Mcm family)
MIEEGYEGSITKEGRKTMKKPAEKYDGFLRLMSDWEKVEEKMVEYVEEEKAKRTHPLERAILEILGLDAQKYCRVQQMIEQSVKKEALHLSPEELQRLSAHINKRLEKEGKVLGLAEAAPGKSEVFFTRYLLRYLVSSVKKENALLRQLDDELKGAHVSTSTSGKIYPSPDENS